MTRRTSIAALRLDPDTAALIAHLHAELGARYAALPGPVDLAPPAVPEYRAAPIPPDLRPYRAELIVEASDVAALRSGLAAAPDALVVDFDDTFAPTTANVQAAYDALAWLAPAAQEGGVALLCRPRALYAHEPRLTFAEAPAIAALCDLGAALCARPDAPLHLYIPKLETVAEAQFWDAALRLAEAHLGLPSNTVKVCLQIETFAGLLNADALLCALRGRAYGLNAGRWDYVFSLTKHLGRGTTTPLPPRSHLTMDVDAMQAYAQTLVAVCRRRGAEAIGGTASLAPDPHDPQPALDAVRADKQREAAQGFTAAWAGLPELLDAVREGLSVGAGAEPSAGAPADLYSRLTNLPAPSALPLADVQDALGVALEVFAAWFAGRGVVTRLGRIEDTATAELARAGLWQWVRVQAMLDDGARLTPDRYLLERRALRPDADPAARLLDTLVLADECAAYFPQVALPLLLESES